MLLYCLKCSIKAVNTRYKINEMVNKFLLAGDTFMSEMHLAYSACGPFTKNKERIQKFKGNRRFTIYLLKKLYKPFYKITWVTETLQI